MAVFRSPALRDATTVTPAEPRRVEPSGILHFTIGVTDLGRARAFYEDVLGCTYWRENEVTVFMRAGNDHFVLSRTGYHEPPNRGTDTLIHHAFIMNGGDFDVAMAHLESHGVEVLLYEDTGHRSFSGRHAYFHDPDGNAIEIIDMCGTGAPEDNRPARRARSHLEGG